MPDRNTDDLNEQADEDWGGKQEYFARHEI